VKLPEVLVEVVVVLVVLVWTTVEFEVELTAGGEVELVALVRLVGGTVELVTIGGVDCCWH